jgi:prepilin-type N-terminal cleavage/methylation domain-containing protein
LKTKGFTLIELLVVVVIIGILVAIALPNFIKIKDKAREAEVKQNLHAVQLAVERYATDYDGIYPFYLYGGESLFNIGTINGVNQTHVWRIYNAIIQPFDMFWLDTDTWDYNSNGVDWDTLVNSPDDLDAGFGDTLEYEGYMPKFPRNPFQTGSSSKVFGVDALMTNYSDHACFGGYNGDLMWNISWFSEVPQMMFFSSPGYEPVRTEYQGNFTYHTRWSDDTTENGHYWYQLDYHPPAQGAVMPAQMYTSLGQADADRVASLDVAGYDLTAQGSERTKGQDLDDAIENNGNYYWRTGYLTLGQERNPWVEAGTIGGSPVEDYDERPYSDGIADFIIIHLGSGMDKKVGADDSLGNS